MSVQDNLLNEKNIVLEQPESETEKNNQMCSFNSDEMEDMCYFRQDEACGDRCIAFEETLILCGLAGFCEEYEPVFLAD